MNDINLQGLDADGNEKEYSLYVSEKQLLDVIGAKTRPFKQELFLYLWNG